MASRIINIDLLNTFVKEIKEVNADFEVFIILIDTLENKEERLEINKENECAIQEFFQEKFFPDKKVLTLRLMSAEPSVHRKAP